MNGIAAGMLAVTMSAFAAPGSAQVQLRAWDGEASIGVTSWRDMPFRTVVRQQYDFSCGSAAVATLLTHHYGRPTSEGEVFKQMYAVGDQAKIRSAGFSLLDMRNYLRSAGYVADGFRMGLDALAAARSPAIALIQTGRYRHFVVIKGVSDRQVLLGDPALGVRAVTRQEFLQMWNGVIFSIRSPATEGRFNAESDWRVRPRAPLGSWVDPLSPDALTRELAPLYQITPVIDVNPAAF